MTSAKLPGKFDKKKATAFWDRNPCGGEWAELAAQMNWRYSKEPWIKDIVARLTTGMGTVLEVGCGPALDTILIAERAKEVIGMDLSYKSLVKANENFKTCGSGNIKLINGDAENISFRDNLMDAVYSYGVLHHTAHIKDALTEIHRDRNIIL